MVKRALEREALPTAYESRGVTWQSVTIYRGTCWVFTNTTDDAWELELCITGSRNYRICDSNDPDMKTVRIEPGKRAHMITRAIYDDDDQYNGDYNRMYFHEKYMFFARMVESYDGQERARD